MATFRDNFAFGIDISVYQDKVDWPTLKHGGVSFAFARSSIGTRKDEKFAEHVQGAYDVDIPMLAYHVLDPAYYADALQALTKLQALDNWLPPDKDEQFQAMAGALRNKKIYGIAIDYELFKDYNGNTITESWLMEIAKQYILRVKRHYSQYPIQLYTAKWFVDGYCKSIENVGLRQDGKHMTDLWVAHYPYSAGVVNLNSWADVKSIYPPNDMNIAGRVTQNPPFLGFDFWKFWQFSGDKFTLPGVLGGGGARSAVDLNFYNGTVEQLNAYLKFTPRNVPIPDPDPEPVDPGTPVDPSTPVDPDTPIPPSVAADIKAIRELLERHFK